MQKSNTSFLYFSIPEHSFKARKSAFQDSERLLYHHPCFTLRCVDSLLMESVIEKWSHLSKSFAQAIMHAYGKSQIPRSNTMQICAIFGCRGRSLAISQMQFILYLALQTACGNKPLC